MSELKDLAIDQLNLIETTQRNLRFSIEEKIRVKEETMRYEEHSMNILFNPKEVINNARIEQQKLIDNTINFWKKRVETGYVPNEIKQALREPNSTKSLGIWVNKLPEYLFDTYNKYQDTIENPILDYSRNKVWQNANLECNRLKRDLENLKPVIFNTISIESTISEFIEEEIKEEVKPINIPIQENKPVFDYSKVIVDESITNDRKAWYWDKKYDSKRSINPITVQCTPNNHDVCPEIAGNAPGLTVSYFRITAKGNRLLKAGKITRKEAINFHTTNNKIGKV